MIGRLWSGRTEPANADDYEAFLRDDLLPSVAELEGARGAYVMRRETLDGAVEFVTLTLFDSIEAVRAFAGENEDVAVIEPRAEEAPRPSTTRRCAALRGRRPRLRGRETN